MLLEAILLVLLGAAVGTFGTLVGAGGGFVLVPILLIVYPERDAATITAMSLFVVLLNALSGSAAYARQQRIDYLSGLVFAAATLPGAVAGAIVVGFIPRRAFDLTFAMVLAGAALLLFLRSPVQAIRAPLVGRGVVHRTLHDRSGTTFAYSFRLWQGAAFSLGIGFVATLLGIGGGIVHVPIMASVLHFPVHIAIATSQFVLGLMAIQGVGTHFATGTLGWNENLGQAALLAAGAVPGAQIGARLARRLRATAIVRILALTLMIVALRLAYTGLA